MSELRATLDAAWAMLEAGSHAADAPARYVTLATVGRAGAEARMLVLRGADRAAGTVELHTDTRTAKVAEVAAEPRATILAWDGAAKLQVRLRVTVALKTGDTAAWERLSDGARALYGGTPAPGTAIAAPSGHAQDPDADAFTVIEARIDEIETLRLGHPHERAVFRRAEGFKGAWVAP